MSLVDDLTAIDLTAIVDARAEISVSVNGEQVRAVVDGGAVTSALGDLGGALAAAGAALEDPQSLFQPLVAAFEDLVVSVGGHDLPVTDLLASVSEGITVLVDLIGGLDDDPLSVFGSVLPAALERFTDAAGDYDFVGLDELGRMSGLVTAVEGMSTDPAVLAELAIDVLTPFSRGALAALRQRVDAVLSATASVRLPTTRTQGLTATLDAIADAAADPAAVARLLVDLERTRVQLIDVLRADLAVVTTAIDRLPVRDLADTLAEVSGGITAAERGILEMFDAWAAELHQATVMVESLDPQQIAAQLRGYLDLAQAFLTSRIEGPVDVAVEFVVGRVRELFAVLPVRSVRAAVTGALHAAVTAITDADLDAPVDAVRGVLRGIADALDVADLGEAVQAALGDVADTLDQALDGVLSAIDAVRSAIEDIAEPAAEVLGRAVTAVEQFQASVTGITAALDQLDLSAAAAEVVDQVRGIREAVEGVVSTVPLPEPVRPLVTQLVEQLEALDLDAGEVSEIPVLAPMLDAVGRLDISDTIGPVVHEGLTALREAVENLVPGSLVAQIEAEIGAALDVVGGFDPATLLAGVTEQLDAIADAIDAVDLVELARPAHEPFAAVLDAWDTVRPSRLLAPVVDAYEAALSGMSLPSVEGVITSLGSTFSAAGERAGQSLAAPLTRLAPEGTTLTPATPTPTPAPGGGVTEPVDPPPPSAGPEVDPTSLRAGDVVRMFGFLPAKLREALATVDASVAGEALRAVDSLVGGLATDLRAAADAVAGIEAGLDASLDTLLAPLGPAQLRAQLALRANLTVGLDGAMATVSRTGPGAVRAELSVPAAPVRARAATATGRTGSLSVSLRATADALGRCRLGGITGDLDGLLAALDPEPLAAELDALAAAAYARTPAVLAAIGEELRGLGQRFMALIGALNPGTLAGRFVNGILGVLREELAVLDPRLLAAELDELHGAVRATLAAYDPLVLATELENTKDAVVTALRGLDPAALLGDLSGLTGLLDKATEALPTNLLTALPAQLGELDEAFAAIDLDALLDRVANLGQEVVDAFEVALAGIRDEVVALLESLRYASGQIQARAEVSVG